MAVLTECVQTEEPTAENLLRDQLVLIQKAYDDGWTEIEGAIGAHVFVPQNRPDSQMKVIIV